MLSEEQIQQNKMKYLNLLSRLGIDLTEYTHYLDSIGFWFAPASAQAFKAYPGGLVEWQLDFGNHLLALANYYHPGKYTEQDIIKVMTGKELYRAVMYEAYKKPQKNAAGQWEDILAYKIKEDRPVFGDLCLSSYMILKNFMSLTDEQALAIIHSRSSDSVSDIHDVRREYPLVSLTRMADTAAQYFLD